MGRSPDLTPEVRIRIGCLHDAKVSAPRIAEQLGLKLEAVKTTVKRLQKDPKAFGARRAGPRPDRRVLTKHDERRICTWAKQDKVRSLKEFREKRGLDVSDSTIRLTLKRAGVTLNRV